VSEIKGFTGTIKYSSGRKWNFPELGTRIDRNRNILEAKNFPKITNYRDGRGASGDGYLGGTGGEQVGTDISEGREGSKWGRISRSESLEGT